MRISSSTGAPAGSKTVRVWIKSMSIEGPLPGVITHESAGTLAVTGPGRNHPRGRTTDDRERRGHDEIHRAGGGDYILRATAYAQQASEQPTKMTFRVNNQALTIFDVLAPAQRLQLPGERVFSNHPSALALQKAVPQVYEYRVQLPAGPRRPSRRRSRMNLPTRRTAIPICNAAR